MTAVLQRPEKGVPEALARFGFFGRGIVYVLVGGIAARVAILQRGRANGPAEALARTLTGWGGRVALFVVALGLFAFVLFRAVQFLRTKSGLARIGYLGSAIGNLVLAISATRILLHFRRGGDASALRALGTRLVSEAWSRDFLVVVGVIVVVVGLVEIARAVLGKLPPDFTSALMPRERKKWASALARGGVFAHGLVLAVAGYSICREALESNPRVLAGTEAALRTIRRGEGGPFVFAVVAAGLLAYGLSHLLLSIHRRRRSA